MCIVHIFLFLLDRKTFLFLDFFGRKIHAMALSISPTICCLCVQSILCAGFQWIWPKKSRHLTRLINLASQEECFLKFNLIYFTRPSGKQPKKAFWKRVVFQKRKWTYFIQAVQPRSKSNLPFLSMSLDTETQWNQTKRKHPTKILRNFCWWLIDGTLEVGTAENFDVSNRNHHRREATRRM